MNNMKEINHAELEKIHGGAGFDPLTGYSIADPIPMASGKLSILGKILGDIKYLFGF